MNTIGFFFAVVCSFANACTTPVDFTDESSLTSDRIAYAPVTSLRWNSGVDLDNNGNMEWIVAGQMNNTLYVQLHEDGSDGVGLQAVNSLQLFYDTMIDPFHPTPIVIHLGFLDDQMRSAVLLPVRVISTFEPSILMWHNVPEPDTLESEGGSVTRINFDVDRNPVQAEMRIFAYLLVYDAIINGCVITDSGDAP